MSRRSRETPEINGGSMADIAFLLLIFFLVATTMDIDTGMLRQLSPISDADPPEIKERNVWVVLINSNNQLMVEGDVMPLNLLKEKTIEFLKNPLNKANLSEKRVENVDPFGEIEITKGLISLQNDRSTSYEMFIAVMNELVAAGNDIKNEFSMQRFGKKYDDLPDHLKDAVRKAVPAVISESDPTDLSK